jgi:hypothetical protein
MKGDVGTARGFGSKISTCALSLNYLFENHGYWNALYLLWLIG